MKQILFALIISYGNGTGEVLVIFWDYRDTPIDAIWSGVTGIRHVRYTTETLKGTRSTDRKTCVL